MVFPVIERYRSEIRGMDFARLDDAQAEDLRLRGAEAHHSNAIEGIHPTPEIAALFAMFLEARVPPTLSRVFVTRYFTERAVQHTLPQASGAGRYG